MTASWYLSDIGRAQGLQDLFKRQSPQRLKVLREHAIAQSVVSSNRIEGVEIDQARIGTVVFGHPALKDRDEEEVAGYRDAFNLDFLCIHAFRDGNGRASRLLLLQTCYLAGIDVGRYVSLERLIEDNKERYYETLEQSSKGWHDGKHDPWPYIGYLLYIIKKAYEEFEERAAEIAAPRGEKTELVELALQSLKDDFSVTDIERLCPNVSRDMIRHLLRNLKEQGSVTCVGRGPGAKWRKEGNKL